MTSLHRPRWWAWLYAWLAGYRWGPCPNCGVPFGLQEQAGTGHIETVPGGEDEPRILCPVCIDAGVGCSAHRGIHRHTDCDVVKWPTEDDEMPAVPADLRQGKHWRVIGDRSAMSEFFLAGSTSLREVAFRSALIIPTEEEAAAREARAGERATQEAAERALAIARHADLMSTVVDPVVQELLGEHEPRAVEYGSGVHLECHGCVPLPDDEGDLWYPDFPCPTWKTINNLAGPNV